MADFKLAPMTGATRLVTQMMLPFPLLFFALAWFLRRLPISGLFVGTGVLLIVVWLAIFLFWRPRRFSLSGQQLAIAFPLRRVVVPRSQIESAREISWRQFCELYPRPLRVGVGGLWGTFGYFRTKVGRVDVYISTGLKMVLIERANQPPLLLSPEGADEFVKSLN